MHESTLARQLVDAVIARAHESGAKRIVRIKGWIAETETLSRESLAFHFGALAKGTLAEGAELAIAIEHVQAHCGGCGATYLPEHHILLCPDCGSAEGRCLGRTGMGIDAIEVDV